MRRRSCAAVALGCCWLAGAHAQERAPGRGQERAPERAQESAPDLEFLEYLGAWAEDDDEWLAIQEWEKDNAADVEKAKPEQEDQRRESEEDDDDESE